TPRPPLPTSELHPAPEEREAGSEPARHREPLRAQEGGVPELRLIARAGVGEDRDDRVAGAELAREPNRAGHVDRTRPSEAEPLLAEQIEQDGERFGVRDLVGLVHGRALEVARDAPLPDPLGDGAALALELAVREPVVHRGAHRIRAGDPDVAALLLQER